MLADLHIPKFQDGEFLTEGDLYPLSRLSLHLFMIAARSLGHTGFALAAAGPGERWNEFRREQDRLVVERLFVISEDGLPFVCTQPHVFELSSVSVDSTVLHASLYVATQSGAFRDGFFGALGASSETYDLGEVRNENGYRVFLHWGENAPVVEGAERHTIVLGRVTDEGFETAPPATVPAALPELQAVVHRLARAIDGLSALLLDPDVANGLERNLLLDRLDRLRVLLDDHRSPTRVLVREARLVAKAAHGFFLRAGYLVDRHDPRYRPCHGLGGRHLEQRLAAIGGVGRGLVDEAIRGFAHLVSETPATGHGQIEWFAHLDTLLGPDRNAQLLEAVRGTDRPPEPRPEREARAPQKPRVIRVDEAG